MTPSDLLVQLKSFTEAATSELIMPTKVQSKDEEQGYRAADIYLMRLPDSKVATKKAPYIIHQLLKTEYRQPAGKQTEALATVRSIFCVYNEDEQEGGLMLQNLIERLQIPLLEQRILAKRFELDMETGIESLVYTNDSAPYYAGEMMSVWKLPSIERKVIL